MSSTGAARVPVPLHERRYNVKAFRRGDDELSLVGEVEDVKPSGHYDPTDLEPITIHHMRVELTIDVPSMSIRDIRIEMPTHPYASCERVIVDYSQLVGTTLGRGFSGRLRELFGGPRGCSHTTALIQAMAPVAVQAAWPTARRSDDQMSDLPSYKTRGGGQWEVTANLDSCHVWSSSGEQVAALRAGSPLESPLWLTARKERRAQAKSSGAAAVDRPAVRH